MNDKLVSVIIPSYNGAECIENTLITLKEQSYKNIEIIVVDDNGVGTDQQKKTQEIVRKFTDVLYLVHEKNRRGSAARNTGIRASSGEYIAFLDDDDIWDRNKIKYQVDNLENKGNEYGLIYGPFIMAYMDGTAEKIVQAYEGDVLFEFLMGKMRIGSSIMMIRRNVLEKVEGFDESFIRHQDWEFITRIARYYKIAYEPRAWTVKYGIFRNSPNEIEKIERYRMYFLDKMNPIISIFNPKQQKDILNYHYSFLAKENIRRKNFRKSIYWIRKTNNPVYCMVKISRDVIKKILRDKKKKSLEELINSEKLVLTRKDDIS